jgi:hypothetical protein
MLARIMKHAAFVTITKIISDLRMSLGDSDELFLKKQLPPMTLLNILQQSLKEAQCFL